MTINLKSFGQSNAALYTIVNKNGMELWLTDIGAAITNILVPVSDGRKIDVALGYDTFDGYKRGQSWYGVTVGRYANRIGGASFRLNGAAVQLEKNEGNNVLHGGTNPYSRRMWQAEVGASPSVTFRLKSPDGDQGMPGAADVAVTFSLTDDNKITIHYHAVADKTTVFNLTNHSYFNLDGHDAGSIAEQYLWLDCDSFTAIDGEFIPTGELPAVKGTPFDFTTAKPIGRDADRRQDGQIALGNGYDHNFVINKPSLDSPFARAWSLKTSIELRAYTDLPGVQFYGGNFMGKDSGEKNGAKYQYRGGFCLETQNFPDAPNQPSFPSAVFAAGTPFDSTTVYQFLLRG